MEWKCQLFSRHIVQQVLETQQSLQNINSHPRSSELRKKRVILMWKQEVRTDLMSSQTAGVYIVIWSENIVRFIVKYLPKHLWIPRFVALCCYDYQPFTRISLEADYTVLVWVLIHLEHNIMRSRKNERFCQNIVDCHHSNNKLLGKIPKIHSFLHSFILGMK